MRHCGMRGRYGFPRRSVGTRRKISSCTDHHFLHDPRRLPIERLVAAQAYPPYKTFPRSRVVCMRRGGIRDRYGFPRRSVGTRRKNSSCTDHHFLHDSRRLLIERLVAAQACPPYKTFPRSRVVCMRRGGIRDRYGFPRRSVGTRRKNSSCTDHHFLHDPRRLLIERLVAAQAYPPYKTFPHSRVVMHTARRNERQVWIPTQERGSQKN